MDVTIPAGQCAGENDQGHPCLRAVEDGSPRTMAEAMIGRRCYCDDCIDGVIPTLSLPHDQDRHDKLDEISRLGQIQDGNPMVRAGKLITPDGQDGDTNG